MQCLKKNPTFPLVPQKGTLHPFSNSRSSLTYPSPLKRITEFPTTTQEETRFPFLILR